MKWLGTSFNNFQSLVTILNLHWLLVRQRADFRFVYKSPLHSAGHGDLAGCVTDKNSSAGAVQELFSRWFVSLEVETVCRQKLRWRHWHWDSSLAGWKLKT